MTKNSEIFESANQLAPTARRSTLGRTSPSLPQANHKPFLEPVNQPCILLPLRLTQHLLGLSLVLQGCSLISLMSTPCLVAAIWPDIGWDIRWDNYLIQRHRWLVKHAFSL